MESILTLENVTKKVKRRTLVHNLSFTVREGEIYGFLGPNGAGKTTTIRMIVGLIKPTDGTIKVGGYNIQKERAKAMAYIGTIVENPEVYSYLTARQNLIHYANLARLGKTERYERIKEVIKLVGLEERIDDKVKTYSLGMRQRLGLAQALIGRPKILILDEPTNGLDPSGMRELRELLLQIARTGVTVFISSHLLYEIEMLCHRVAIINNGELVTEENVKDLTESSPLITLDVSDVEKAKTILEGMIKAPITIEDQQLVLQLEREAIAQAIRTLVYEDIKVYAAIPKKQTLEGSFLKLTRQIKGEQ